MDQLARDDFFSPARPLLEIGTDERVLQQYLDLLDLGREEPIGFQQLAAAGVHGILAGALAAVRRGEGSQQDEERVRQAKAYLEERVEGTVSMPKLAAELCMSLRQLERVFRRATGMTPHEFYRQLKMRRAQQLLGTDLPLKAIANQLGFESQFHFSRAFKKHFGLPPSQWRGG